MDSRAARTLPKSEPTEAQHTALKQHGGRLNVVLSSAGLSNPDLLPQAKRRLDIIEALMNPRHHQGQIQTQRLIAMP
jgi:hypothetical protein